MLALSDYSLAGRCIAEQPFGLLLGQLAQRIPVLGVHRFERAHALLERRIVRREKDAFGSSHYGELVARPHLQGVSHFFRKCCTDRAPDPAKRNRPDTTRYILAWVRS